MSGAEEEPEDLSVRRRHKSSQTETWLHPFQRQILFRFSSLLEELKASRRRKRRRRKKPRHDSDDETEEEEEDEEEGMMSSPPPLCLSKSNNYSLLLQLLSKLQRANLQMGGQYGGVGGDLAPHESSHNNDSSPFQPIASSFPRSENDTQFTLPGGDYPPEFRTEQTLDFLNSSFHSAILRSSDPELLNFPGANEEPSSLRSPPPSSSFERSEDHPEFLHYPSSNESAVSGPHVSPIEGCPYPNYGPPLPPYPSLNHSYAAPPLPPPTGRHFIKQEADLITPLETNNNNTNPNPTAGATNNATTGNNTNNELNGFSGSSSSLIKGEKDPYSSSSSSTSSTSSASHLTAASNRSRHSKDEQRARKLGVPFSVDDVVGLPMDEYNDMIARHVLSDEQLSLCRDIRRRGKNKVAAQNCRKRKINQITELKSTIELNREIQNRLIEQRSHLIRMRQEFAELVRDAERQYWSKSKYDPELFEFRYADDGSNVSVVPKISTSEDVSDSTTNYRH
eukprot:TRINITY_DN682_c0_g1_i2.p1 TRINITY_DN682_c0_g1~~TRINITY_DN682_c0_g1_i2.p1  ORF type:complete len:508 (+),score=179.93 TRINITY_DN682_c0_g1_i2:83-1606(+)